MRNEKLRDTWGLLFQENASKLDKGIVVSKAQFVWPIIVALCQISEQEDMLDNVDYDIKQDVIAQYNRLIDSQTERFSFTTRVTSDFAEFRSLQNYSKLKEYRDAFIESTWTQYIEEVGANELEEEIAETLVKMILNKILIRESTIKTIKRETRL